MSSAHKKVIVRRLTGETLPGYLPLSAFVHNRTIDLLDLGGRVIPLSINDIKHICYVRDFNLTDPANPERLTRRTFLARPRTEGLWLRMTFRAGDLHREWSLPQGARRDLAHKCIRAFELGRGIAFATEDFAQVQCRLAPTDITLLDDLIHDAGLFLAPPDTRSNTQRIYVPRTAITDLQLIAVITSPSRRKPLPAASLPTLQEDLFNAILPPSTRPN